MPILPSRSSRRAPFPVWGFLTGGAGTFLAALGAVGLVACTDGIGPPSDSMTVGETEIGSTIIQGVYDLTASVTDFDPAWGYDMTGYQYTATLRFEQDASVFPGIGGTFWDLRLTGLNIEPRAPMSGVITTPVRDGRMVIELEVRDDLTSFHLALLPSGDLRGPVMQGRFGCCGHIAGVFTAVRRGVP